MNLAEITTGPITAVAELIDLDESLGGGPMDPSSRRWAFRGQPRDYGTLAPSFQRQFSRQSVGTAEVIERRLIDAFRKHYADLKDRSPDMPPPAHIGPGYDLRCLSVMQHYEIPTRLLDWTASFWTAIYFACASEPSSQAELWYYDRQIFELQRAADPTLLSLLDTAANSAPEPSFLGRRGGRVVVELDPQITPRMRQQLAHHTVSADVFADHAPLLLELQQQAALPPSDPPPLGRVIIEGACKSKALQFLAEEMKITASTVFPDVVGLGRFLRWQFESLRTMLL
jgi:hypothetical protein